MQPRSLIKLLKEHDLQFSSVLRALTINPRDPRARGYLKELAEQLIPELMKTKSKRGRLKYSVEDVETAVSNGICFTDVCKQLGLAVHGSNYETLRKIITTNKIDISHFSRTAALKRGRQNGWIAEEVFCQNSKVPRASLRRLAIKFNILEYKCKECLVVNLYNNKPISLTLDHKNGITNDNRVSNLRWLCPNCHSQTPNYCGKNIGN